MRQSTTIHTYYLAYTMNNGCHLTVHAANHLRQLERRWIHHTECTLEIMLFVIDHTTTTIR